MVGNGHMTEWIESCFPRKSNKWVASQAPVGSIVVKAFHIWQFVIILASNEKWYPYKQNPVLYQQIIHSLVKE